MTLLFDANKELQTGSGHNKNAFFDKQGCHTFANDESKTVIYPDLTDVLFRFGGSRVAAMLHGCCPG